MDMEQTARALRRNPALLQSVMASRDGQALMGMLEGGGFSQAVQNAARGDTAEMAERIRRISQTPGGAALLERISQAVRSGGV